MAVWWCVFLNLDLGFGFVWVWDWERYGTVVAKGANGRGLFLWEHGMDETDICDYADETDEADKTDEADEADTMDEAADATEMIIN